MMTAAIPMNCVSPGRGSRVCDLKLGARLVNLLQIAGDSLVNVSRQKFQVVAYHVDNAQLNLGVGVLGGNGFRETLQTVHAGDENIVKPAVLQRRQHARIARIQPLRRGVLLRVPSYSGRAGLLSTYRHCTASRFPPPLPWSSIRPQSHPRTFQRPVAQ